MEKLSKDAANLVLSQLSYKEVLRCCRVSMGWRKYLRQRCNWRALLVQLLSSLEETLCRRIADWRPTATLTGFAYSYALSLPGRVDDVRLMTRMAELYDNGEWYFERMSRCHLSTLYWLRMQTRALGFLYTQAEWMLLAYRVYVDTLMTLLSRAESILRFTTSDGYRTCIGEDELGMESFSFNRNKRSQSVTFLLGEDIAQARESLAAVQGSGFCRPFPRIIGVRYRFEQHSAPSWYEQLCECFGLPEEPEEEEGAKEDEADEELESGGKLKKLKRSDDDDGAAEDGSAGKEEKGELEDVDVVMQDAQPDDNEAEESSSDTDDADGDSEVAREVEEWEKGDAEDAWRSEEERLYALRSRPDLSEAISNRYPEHYLFPITSSIMRNNAGESSDFLWNYDNFEYKEYDVPLGDKYSATDRARAWRRQRRVAEDDMVHPLALLEIIEGLGTRGAVFGTMGWPHYPVRVTEDALTNIKEVLGATMMNLFTTASVIAQAHGRQQFATAHVLRAALALQGRTLEYVRREDDEDALHYLRKRKSAWFG